MKFLLPILLAAPAVMGRACKVRPAHTVDPVYTRGSSAPENTAVVSEPIISQAPQLGYKKPSPAEQVESAISDAAPLHTTLAVQAVPKKAVKATSKPKPKAASKPKTVSKPKPKPSNSGSSSSSSSKALGNGASVSGSSTFYGGNLSGGNCMFTTYTLPAGILGTAFSGQKWDNSANCGACIEVTGPSGTVKAMVSINISTLTDTLH
jgi:hypothetical protein